MAQYIDKSAVVAEIERRLWLLVPKMAFHQQREELEKLLSFINTLEVKDPYEQCIQYPSIKDGIQSHAETYSFNIESELFNQLTKEQQALWRKEIEQACISGGDAGYLLAKDSRYKENLEVKEVDLEKAARHYLLNEHVSPLNRIFHQADIKTEMQYHADIENAFKAGFELGLKAQKGE